MTNACRLRTLVALAAAAAGALIGAPLLAQDADAPPTPEERRAAALDLFSRLDKNRNQRLSGDELPTPGWLERFDRDGDDEITKRELTEIVDRGPGYDRLFLLRDRRARARNAMGQFDQDKDGKVSRGEYPGDDNAFKGADRNRDDFLEWSELLRLADRELDDIRRKMKSPGRYQFLSLFDLNNDRMVTMQEYDGPARAFRKYDDNGDDIVDYYEIYPDRRPREEEMAKPEPESLNALGTLDTDGDGKVARAEFKGTDAAWRRLDRNGDGWLTNADAR